MNRIAKLLISAVFLAICSLRDLLSRLTGSLPPGKCVVLYYHAIPTHSKSRFAKQMDVLIRLSEPIPADWKLPLPSGGRYTAVTFDDAYRNVAQNALPAMRARRIPATVFVATEILGKSPQWFDSSADSEQERRTMSEGELREISADMVVIGSHSLTHGLMSQLTAAEAKHELSESRRILERMLQRPIRLFSFPYGAYSKELIDWSQEAGYERVFTTLPHLALSEPGEFVTGRVRVDPSDWGLEFRLKLLGAYRWLPHAFAMKQRILPKLRKQGLPQEACASE